MELNDDLAIYHNRAWAEYLEALLEQQQADLAVALCARRRANALARLHGDGWSMAVIADAAQLSRERVWQLIDRDRRGVPVICADDGDDDGYGDPD